MSGIEVAVSKSQSLAFKIAKSAELLESNKEVTITAINSAISAAINLVELLKHRVKGLYQINKFERVEGSNKTRLVIKLSLSSLDTSEKGYQGPIPDGEVQEKTLEDLKKLPWEGNERTGEPRRERRFDRRGRRRPWARRGREIGTQGEERQTTTAYKTSNDYWGDVDQDATNDAPAERDSTRRTGRRPRGLRRTGRQDRGGFSSNKDSSNRDFLNKDSSNRDSSARRPRRPRRSRPFRGSNN